MHWDCQKMAKGPKREMVSSSVREFNIDEQHWRKIENAARKKFNTSERGEISECARVYYREKDWLDSGVNVKDVENLHREILDYASQICRIADETMANNSPKRPSLNALAIRYSTPVNDDEPGFSLYSEMHKLALAAQRMVIGLKQEPQFAPRTTNRVSKVAALEEFLFCVITGATDKRARTIPGYIKDSAAAFKSKEFTRWGLLVTPQSEEFRSFLNAVLEQDFTQDQIRGALEGARKLGAITLGEAFDRVQAKGV